MGGEPVIFTENAVAYSLYKHLYKHSGPESRFFFKFQDNLTLRENRPWYYYCAPDIDVIEIRQDEKLIAYELKGERKHRRNPPLSDAIGQAIAYLDLPWIKEKENDHGKFKGGAFDRVYIVCARRTAAIDASEARILDTVPLGAMLALPDGQFVTIKEARHNPNQDIRAKDHVLQNVNSLEKHTLGSKIGRSISAAGKEYEIKLSSV
jgi:hypothetical protein